MNIKGIISADRPCEACGNTNVERLVVLENDNGELVRVGSTCAGYMLLGKKNRKNGSIVLDKAKAAQLAVDLMDKHGTEPAMLKRIAQAVWNRHGYCTEIRAGRVQLAPAFCA